MDAVDVLALSVAFLTFVAVILVHIRRKSSTTVKDTERSDEETLGPLNVNTAVDHDEQHSLLPKFAGLLLSPWHSATTDQNEEPPLMRPVRKKARSISLSMPLSTGTMKHKKAAQVPIKKVHVPYFFPLLDETAAWWQMHQSIAAKDQQTMKQENRADVEDNWISLDGTDETQSSEVSAEDSLQVHEFLTATLSEDGKE